MREWIFLAFGNKCWANGPSFILLGKKYQFLFSWRLFRDDKVDSLVKQDFLNFTHQYYTFHIILHNTYERKFGSWVESEVVYFFIILLFLFPLSSPCGAIFNPYLTLPNLKKSNIVFYPWSKNLNLQVSKKILKFKFLRSQCIICIFSWKF